MSVAAASRLDVLRRSAEDAAGAQALLDTVSRLREAAGDAGRVAASAVGQRARMATAFEGRG